MPGREARVLGSEFADNFKSEDTGLMDLEESPLTDEKPGKKKKTVMDGPDDGTQGLTKGMLVLFMASALLLPGGGLVIHSFIYRRDCNTEWDACYIRCQEAFKEQERVFKSDYHPEQECKAYCDLKQENCASQADAIFLGGGLLVGGLVFGLCLLSSLESILESFSRRATRPRPAYKEPVFTEEEERNMAREIGPRERAFWKFIKQEVVDVDLKEVMCRDCQVPIEVDARWLSADRGGMNGARCPRCLRIIVGLL